LVRRGYSRIAQKVSHGLTVAKPVGAAVKVNVEFGTELWNNVTRADS
jgi:hypothetical protein